MPRQQSFIFITNRPSSGALAERIARDASLELEIASSTAKGQKLLTERLFDAIVLDIEQSPKAALNCLRRIMHDDPEATVIVAVGADDVPSAVQALHHGASEVLVRPLNVERLGRAIRSALDANASESSPPALRKVALQIDDKVAIVGQTEPMREVEHLIAKAAPTDATVLICGESGTGKELVARAIHLQSKRRKAAFVGVDCGSLVEGLFESELFGHVKGSFTGASVTKHGRFELADGGTIFLDEIGQIGPNLQGKLLRVLQEREITKVGSNQVVNVDVRVIAATNTQLHVAAAQGKFRRELFYRLHVIPILLPPLRQRKADSPLLARHFLEKYRLARHKRIQRISDKAMDRLMNYAWPGNVRELEHTIERAVVLAETSIITARDLTYFSPGETFGEYLPTDGRLSSMEKAHIERSLERFGGHRSKTAEYLGIDRKTLRAKMAKYGLSALSG